MNEPQPLFTIITVTWNAEKVIRPTLDSVASQTFTDFEYIVMDGASADGTCQLVKDTAIPSTRLFSEPDEGLYHAMNKAIDKATGRYLIFLNAGDTFAEHTTLATIAEHTSSNPGVIYGQAECVDENRKPIDCPHWIAPEHLTIDAYKRGQAVCHQAFIARRDIATHYSLRYTIAADFDWCIRTLKQSEHNAYVGEAPIIHYLMGGLSIQHAQTMLTERFRIMCHHFGVLPTLVRHIPKLRHLPNMAYQKIRHLLHH